MKHDGARAHARTDVMSMMLLSTPSAMQNILEKEEIDFLVRQERPTFGAAQIMTHLVAMAKLPYEQQAAMDLDIRWVHVFQQALRHAASLQVNWQLSSWHDIIGLALWSLLQFRELCTADAMIMTGTGQLCKNLVARTTY